MMIIRTIENYLSNRPERARETNCFHVSQLHHPCLRYLYFSYFGKKQEFDPQTLRIFDNGHGVHERLQGYLHKAGVLIEKELSVSDKEYQIYGRCDGIVQLNRKRGVLEIKSINAKGFAGELPKKEHVVQTMMYIHLLGLRGGVILYENKDTQELKEFYMALDNEVVEKTLEKVKSVLSYISKKQIPPRRYHFCDYCAFHSLCYEGEDKSELKAR